MIRSWMILWSLLQLVVLQVDAFVSSHSNAVSGLSLAVQVHHDDDTTISEESDDYWNSKYLLLKNFQEQFGHTYVPRNWGDPQLSEWVKKQDKLVQSSDMSLERMEKLATVGIVETSSDDGKNEYTFPPTYVLDPTTGSKLYASAWEQRWEDMYERLVHFKNEHDGFVNCNCMRGYNLDLRLAQWVQIQRENLHLGVMRRDRQNKLESIGLEPLRLHVF